MGFRNPGLPTSQHHESAYLKPVREFKRIYATEAKIHKYDSAQCDPLNLGGRGKLLMFDFYFTPGPRANSFKQPAVCSN